jgi:DNA-binding beta-propeller fold protein YncE
MAVFVLGCSNGFAPLPAGRAVLVTSGEAHALTVVDASSGNVIRSISLPWSTFAAAMSPDSSLLYLVTSDLVAIDTRTFAIQWRETLSTTVCPRLDRWDGVSVYASSALVATSDGTGLYAAPAFRSDTQGVALLNARMRNLASFGVTPGPRERGLAVVPPNELMPSGALLLGGRRDYYAVPAVGWLYILDPSTVAIVDSTGIIDTDPYGNRYLLLPTPDASGRFLYIMALGATDGIFKYDFSSRRVVASAPLGSGNAFALSPDGTRLYQPLRSSTPDGSASLLVYDADLSLLATIPLPQIDGLPAIVQDVAVSPDGARVYITAGTGSGVLDGPIQAGHLIAVDPVARTVLWSKALGVWAPRQLFVH